MKAGTWYIAGFVVVFVYFYVYAVNYVRGEQLAADAAGFDLVGDYVLSRSARQFDRHNNVQGTASYYYHFGRGGA